MKTKKDYMRELERRIRTLPAEDARELLADYEAHFTAGLEAGKSEEEICRSLGSVRSVAQEILTTTWVRHLDTAPKKLRSPGAILQMLVMILILAPFNFFMLICPFLILFVLVFAGWTIPFAIGAVAFAGIAFFWQTAGDPIGLLNGASLVFIFLGTVGLACLSGLFMYVCTKTAFKLLLSFFKWNLDLINARRPTSPLLEGRNA